MVAATYTDWYIGLSLSFFTIVVVVIIVAVILALAALISDRARAAEGGVDAVRAQTMSLSAGVDKVNDSAVQMTIAACGLSTSLPLEGRDRIGRALASRVESADEPLEAIWHDAASCAMPRTRRSRSGGSDVTAHLLGGRGSEADSPLPHMTHTRSGR